MVLVYIPIHYIHTYYIPYHHSPYYYYYYHLYYDFVCPHLRRVSNTLSSPSHPFIVRSTSLRIRSSPYRIAAVSISFRLCILSFNPSILALILFSYQPPNGLQRYSTLKSSASAPGFILISIWTASSSHSPAMIRVSPNWR
jgi:hypothetical protein